MTTPPFDTQQFITRLIDKGVPQVQAEAHLQATIDAISPLAAKALNKLDSTDYENIFLQVRNRGWKWFLSVAAFFGAATVIGALGTVFVSINRSVDRYVTSEAFKTQVMATAIERLVGIDERLKTAEQGLNGIEKEIGALGNLPLTATNNGVMMTDKKGNSFYVEIGTAESGSKVVFKSPFRNRPTFLIQPTGGVLNDENGSVPLHEFRRSLQQERMEYGIAGVPALFVFLPGSRNGVKIRSESQRRTYDWVAIGR